MNRTPRELLILTLFPALVVLITYLFRFNQQPQLEAAVTAMHQAQGAQVAPEAILAEEEAVKKLEDELAQIKTEAEDLQKRKVALETFQKRLPGERAIDMHSFTTLMWSCGLYTFEESPVENELKLPESTQSILKKFAPSGVSVQHKLYAVKFVGRYQQVIQALDNIANSDAAVYPVGLYMTEAPADSNLRTWTLVLWL